MRKPPSASLTSIATNLGSYTWINVFLVSNPVAGGVKYTLLFQNKARDWQQIPRRDWGMSQRKPNAGPQGLGTATWIILWSISIMILFEATQVNTLPGRYAYIHRDVGTGLISAYITPCNSSFFYAYIMWDFEAYIFRFRMPVYDTFDCEGPSKDCRCAFGSKSRRAMSSFFPFGVCESYDSSYL